MYKCKTYGGELRQYLKRVDVHSVIDVFLKEVSPDYLKQVAIRYLSNPEAYTIAEIEELFNYK